LHPYRALREYRHRFSTAAVPVFAALNPMQGHDLSAARAVWSGYMAAPVEVYALMRWLASTRPRSG